MISARPGIVHAPAVLWVGRHRSSVLLHMRVLLLLLAAVGIAKAQTTYEVEIDLKNVVDDRIHVSMRVPAITADTATIVFPVVTPGTYEQQDWWRYVHDFAAFDIKGKPLPVRRSADSQFVVERARQLHSVTYRLDDSFDVPDDGRPPVFEPSGTSFEADTIMQLNHCGIVGFVDGLQRRPFHVTVTKPARLYGASALRIERVSDTVDRYRAESYDMLNDSPVLYAVADTASFVVGGTHVLVACAHRKNHNYAERTKHQLDSVCKAVAAFLGTMPVDRYAFLINVWYPDTMSNAATKGAFGALEHSYSSLYFMHPEMMKDVKDIAAHEFLHILMPLNLHSEEIETFDFRTPNMSRHLWLYEGMTEYFAHLSLVRYGLMQPTSFMKSSVNSAIRQSATIPHDFRFTEFSRRVLEQPYQSMYPLVYTYGMLNGFLVDILMREATGGKQGALDLVKSLSAKYGRSKPFIDTLLFNDIDSIAPPSVSAYCRRYINGNERIPLEDVLAKIGWKYDSVSATDGWTFGVYGSLKYPEGNPTYVLTPTDTINPLGVVAGDKLISVNGVYTLKAFNTIRTDFMYPPDERPVTIVVRRNDQELELKASSYMGKRRYLHVLTDLHDDAGFTESQRVLRAQVFGQ